MQIAPISRLSLLADCGLLLLALHLPIHAQEQANTPRDLVYSGPCRLGEALPDTPRFEVTGVVLNNVTGSPIEGATVKLSSECISDERARATTTDDEGRFTFTHVRGMDAYITATFGEAFPEWNVGRRADDPLNRYTIGPHTGVITLRLAPPAYITGVVRGADGAPLSPAMVTLRCLRPWGGWPQHEGCSSSNVKPDGSYRLGPLLPGRYAVVIEPEVEFGKAPAPDADGVTRSYVPVRQPALTDDESCPYFDLKEGEQKRLDFKLKREVLHHITGAITGKSWTTVNVVDRLGSQSYPVKLLAQCCEFEAWAPNGSFRIVGDGNLKGEVSIKVQDGDLSGVALPAHSDDRLTIPIEVSSTAPPNENSVCLFGETACGFWYANFLRFNPQGEFDVVLQSSMNGSTSDGVRHESVEVPSGNYELIVSTTGNVYAQTISSGATNLLRERLAVNPGDIPSPIRIVLAEGEIVTGTTLRNGKPARAFVYAVPSENDARAFQGVPSDEHGQYKLEGLAPIQYHFFASDVELNLDLHDPDAMRPWLQSSETRSLASGSTTSLDLHVLTPAK
ncbi:hypothetical protein Acid345_3071 [Candidatus Koribacter versatilis Ellin345]|uniref:Intradiol ring-cleavage dioxygenases domain-containing protein n=1 Tax=Koribacter versatilis (strain Ellin345) TaxID=204669 RepID=Q1IM28_KORVE|nr:carboxypeptidase-like regulatory domain-containing protein [Candidatus Koribacter versatilis]ABF42072.1 hypothetical protein Acid345_3071 [Candidatus Koribacter versatilis Ellin345]